MARGPKTPGWLEGWIVEVWLEAQDTGKKLTAEEVRDRVSKRLQKNEKLQYLPSLRKVQDVLTEARRRVQAEDESKGEKHLDDPWSVGVSALHNIPPEATGDLLAVWKLSLAVDWKFTIRQAKWVARLRAALPGASPELLYKWATLYERRERTASAQGKLPDTTDLDAELAFQHWKSQLHRWEYDQAVVTGAVPPSRAWISRDPGIVFKALESFPVPFGFFVFYGGRFLSEVGGLDIDQRRWWEQAESVMAFWLREITARVKRWTGLDLGSGGGLPGDKEREEWEDMGRRLAVLVIAEAERLEKRSDGWAVWWDWDNMMRDLKRQANELFDAAHEHRASGLRAEAEQLNDTHHSLWAWAEQHRPKVELERPPWVAWKPTKFLEELGITESQQKGGQEP